MTEQIGVTYRPIYVGPTPTGGYHMALFYRNSEGQTKVIEVGPSIDPPGPLPLSKAVVQEHFFSNNNADSPWGKIAGGERPRQRSDEFLPQSVLSEGDNLSPKWDSVKSTLNDVMKKGYEYQGPFDQNSNTFVREAARSANIPTPNGIATDIDGGTAAYWTPGAQHLSDPIDQDQSSTSVNRDDAGGAVPVRQLSRKISPSADYQDSFDDRFGNWTASDGGMTPRNPNQPASPSQSGRPPGIFSGKPMPLWITPPPIFGPLDRSGVSSNARGNSGKPRASIFDTGTPPVPFAERVSLFERRNSVGNGFTNDAATAPDYAADLPSSPQPQALPASTFPLLQYLQYLKLRDGNQSQAPMSSSIAPAVPLAPADNSNPPAGGLLARLMAVAGVDPDNPDQPAPSPFADQLRGFNRDDAAQPWFRRPG